MTQRKPRGLFVNPKKANCSIYESGRMMYQALRRSSRYELDWCEIDRSAPSVGSGYDFFAFNYHHITMGWLDPASVRHLPGVKMTFVLEVNPGDPFVLCPKDAFDAYLALDPSLVHADRRVFAFPRPIELPDRLEPFHEPEVPVIGSFGFGTPGKGFELVVEAVNREFDRAKVRVNIPPGTYADPITQTFQRRPYPEYLAELCRRVAKPGVEVEVTHRFMDERELIGWCAENTLNCFLYNRDQPGLSATTDQAIAAARPLAVSTNPTFRHIHPYLAPYPYRSLRESIARSVPEVLEMRREWAPERFAERFEEVLATFGLLPAPAHRVRLRTKPPATRRPVLLVNHPQKRCGIHQYGEDVARALARSERYEVRYAECGDEASLRQAVAAARPEAIVYNHYPATMPWLTPAITRAMPGVQLGVMHEVTQEEADRADDHAFDFHLCPDPTLIERNPLALRMPRLVPLYVNIQPLPERLRIGSFGFPFPDKGFVRLVERVQEEFDEADVVLHMPANDIVQVAQDMLARCRAVVRKPGIRVAGSTEFADARQVLDFLAGNHLNVFLYDVHKDRGISSVVEKAIAAGRPVAVNRCGMFRHVRDARPSICVEDRSLREILATGYAPLVPFLADWSEPAFVKAMEELFDRVLGLAAGKRREATMPSTPAPRQGLRTVRLGAATPPPAAGAATTPAATTPAGVLNRVLDDRARAHYAPVIEELFRIAPAMMARKIPAANVQQAFVFDTVRTLLAGFRAPRVLCVGAFEDTASAGVKACGYRVEEIDPAINWDLDAFWRRPETRKGGYDVVFSTSVIEHVEDDELFAAQLADLLAPGGYAVLTCDFNQAYRPGDPVPREDFRFYTPDDLGRRLLARMPGCRLADRPAWSHGPPDFSYAGIPYVFASFVVRKEGGAEAPAPLPVRGARLRVNRTSGFVMGPQR